MLAQEWGTYFNITCPHCHNTYRYHVNNVTAQQGDGATTGAVIGGILGLLGGPLGMLVGGAIGGTIGDSTVKQEVSNFNDNYL